MQKASCGLITYFEMELLFIISILSGKYSIYYFAILSTFLVCFALKVSSNWWKWIVAYMIWLLSRTVSIYSLWNFIWVTVIGSSKFCLVSAIFHIPGPPTSRWWESHCRLIYAYIKQRWSWYIIFPIPDTNTIVVTVLIELMSYPGGTIFFKSQNSKLTAKVSCNLLLRKLHYWKFATFSVYFC